MIEIVTPESVGLSSTRLRRVTEWLEDQITQERFAGASVLVGRRGRIACFETAGMAELKTGKPFQRDTIVRIYSMTKPVTSVAAMMLYEQGCFQLDDPIAIYLPEFADTLVWRGGDADVSSTVAMQSPITVRQLMTHTSGLTYGFMHANVVDAQYRKNPPIDFSNSSQALAESVRRLAQIPLLCQPGSQWNYSVATDVLGRLVEVWSGLALDEFFRSRIFQPLDMVDAGFHVLPENHHRFAAMYSPLSGGDLGNVSRQLSDPTVRRKGGLKLLDAVEGSRFLSPAVAFSGGGGLTASMRDYARFCQMLLGGGQLEGTRILGRKTVEYMRRNHLPENRDMAAMGQPVWSETSYQGIGFGLGFAVVIDPVAAAMITSQGEHHWGGAASTHFWIDPQEDMFVVFLTQLMPSSTYPVRRELRARVYQAIED